jgi:hypothetical protein
MPTIRDVLEQLRVPVAGHGESHHVRPGWLGIVHCPFCGSDRAHLAFPLEGGLTGNCYRCGRHTLWDVLIALGLDRKTVAEALAGVRPERRSTKDVPVVGRYRPPRGVGPLAPVHTAYLRKRGVGADQAALWGIEGIGLASRLPWRLFLPVFRLGRPVSWTTRSLSPNAKRKYVSADPSEEDEPIKTLLYGEDMARNAAVVIEGPMDAVRVGPGAVALFGLVATDAQVLKIAGFPVRAICMDNGEQAQASGRRLAAQLAGFPGETAVVRLESGTDPGSADPEEIAELRRRFLE